MRRHAPTEREIQIDQLVATSRTWMRVQEALIAVLAKYPDVAREIVTALKEVEL